MLKIIVGSFLLILFVNCGTLQRNIDDDQEIILPHSLLTCGQLRKQFENGYIHLKDFIDRIRTCKDNLGKKRHRHRHRHYKHDMTNLFDGHKNTDVTYTDYLVPVVQDTSPTIPSVLTTVFPTDNNSDKQGASFSEEQIISPLMQNQGFDQHGNPNAAFLPRKQHTVNGIVVDSVAGQLILRSLQNNAKQHEQQDSLASSFSQPTTSYTATVDQSKSWSEYFQLRSMLNNMGYGANGDNNNLASTGVVDKIDQALVRSQLSHVSSEVGTILSDQTLPSTGDIRGELKQAKKTSFETGDTQPSMNEESLTTTDNQPVEQQNAYNRDQMFTPHYNDQPNAILSLPTTQITLRDDNFLSPTFHNTIENVNIQNSEDLPQSSKSAIDDLQKVDLDLSEDVSLLNENKIRMQHLSLTGYDSFTPQIVERIAQRSEINHDVNHTLANANNIKLLSIAKQPINQNASKRIYYEDEIQNGNSAAKDILDIKYAQLESKLLSDLKRRQAILQRLEQETMVHHYFRPGVIPLSKLGDIFNKINLETAQRTSLRKSIENSVLNKKQAYQLQDELGLFETNESPTSKRHHVTFKDVLGMEVNSLSNQGLNFIKERLPKNFVLSQYAKPTNHVTINSSVIKKTAIANQKNHTEKSHYQSNETKLSNVTDSNLIRAEKILNHSKTQKPQNNTKLQSDKENTYEKRASIAKHSMTASKPETFSRNILFSNKLYNDVIRAAMKRKDAIPTNTNTKQHNLEIIKKNVIEHAVKTRKPNLLQIVKSLKNSGNRI